MSGELGVLAVAFAHRSAASEGRGAWISSTNIVVRSIRKAIGRPPNATAGVGGTASAAPPRRSSSIDASIASVSNAW
jgi:hypothetical protein